MTDQAHSILSQLLNDVSRAGHAERITYRDRVAAFGSDAIVALEPWLTDRRLSGFAIRTVARAATSDHLLAVKSLRDALSKTDNPIITRDLREELLRLGVPTPTRTMTRAHERPPVARQRGEVDRTLALGTLVHGDAYKRADLHASGLGGNVQKGISYPAGGDHALLFSNPARVDETGYHDRWDDGQTFIYFGEWDGPGDMRMEGGNRQIVERSPELHLFVAGDTGYRYEGRFQYVGRSSERTLRGGLPATAIVFQLRRAR
jgi:hypothetical protein